jgi:SAM-dependent methyltransferase
MLFATNWSFPSHKQVIHPYYFTGSMIRYKIAVIHLFQPITMGNFVDNYCEMPAFVRRPMWRIWHNLLNRFDKDSTVNFMNYGYAGLNGAQMLNLEKEDEYNRYCIQLYDHVVNPVELRNKKVVEVGSGRGGGADYVSRYYKPKEYTGVDISSAVIGFCNRFYDVPGLRFIQGRAEKIPVEAGTVDAVVNVESSRCYSSLNAFFSEVHRILSPDGYFLFADVIDNGRLDELRENFENCGFRIKSETEITQNVARGLELDSRRREGMIQNKIPGWLKSLFAKFAATEGTDRFDSFRNGKFKYWSFVLSKAN